MKPKNSTVFLYLRVALAGTLVLAAVALAVTATKPSVPSRQPNHLAYTPKKVDVDFFEKGRNAHAIIGAENNPASSPEVEAYLRRAFPASEISGDSTLAAQQGWASLNAGAHSSGSWQLIGPSKPTYPQVLTPFLFDGAQYIAGGRVTAISIASTCNPGNCPIYIAAAGGGIWKAPDARAGQPQWQFISGAFGINAIGSMLLDRSDPTSNTLYVGTGEPNASVDSEAGVGVYKTTDGGKTWVLVPGTGIFFQRAIGQMDFDKDHKLLVPIASSVRGINSEDSGPLSSGATGHPLPTRGLYRCDGTTCTLLRPTFIRGSTTVKTDPTHSGVIYVNAFAEGIWRSSDNGATWTQIKAPLSAALSTDRAEFDVTALPNGNTRMYAGIGNSSSSAANLARFFRTDDASGAAVFTDLTTSQVQGYCGLGPGAQCWYDNVIYTPSGNPDVVYVGGSFSYPQLHGPSNGRAWLLSTDGGANWTDLTQDGDPNHADAIHPDQHAITTFPGKPFQFVTGSDGGVVMSDGSFANVSAKCSSRGLGASDLALCQQLLSRVPHQLINQNNFFSTLQFQSLSISSQRPKNLLQGGTQDNGTFQYNGSSVVWPQIIYGDGGQSGFMVTNDSVRFNTFSGQFHDGNFQKGDPTKWVILSAPIASSPEGSYFYPPIIADPSPAAAATIFQGSFSVWRTQDWGGNQAFLEANCPEFTTSAFQPGCGDFVPLGGTADGSETESGDLTGSFYGGFDARAFGAVSSLARTAQNTNTLWAATGAGRLFVSDNADTAAALSVVWNRVDSTGGVFAPNSPTRAINAVTVDPANAGHVWVAYSGYNNNGVVPTGPPGHVFDVMRTGTSSATFTDISYNLPDFPITDIKRDDLTGDLYAASDFGVMKLPFGTTTWAVAGTGLPMVECPGLTINSTARVLYVATHGRSAWQLNLP
jgi:hypothetical protein